MDFIKLFGDGIHDDTAAIQQRIDNGGNSCCLPQPEKFYLISKPLELPSNFSLVLPRYATVRLADGSNCVMLKNKMKLEFANRTEEKFWYYVNEVSPDSHSENIEVRGGIWDCNNLGQNPNPIQSHVFEPLGFSGFGMLFYKIKGFKLSGLTIKDPTNFAVTLDSVTYFTVDDIDFDFNLGNPMSINMDGIHLNGNCHFGVIKNLRGTCYDDMVALNADEGSGGNISNVEIHGLYAENCHSAVRLLSVKYLVENIHIHDVFGTYYQYCIGITNLALLYPDQIVGHFKNIKLNDFYVSKASRDKVYPWPDSQVFSIIFIEGGGSKINNLTISDLHRTEKVIPIETIHLGEDSKIGRLNLSRIYTENETGKVMPVFNNLGEVDNLNLCEIQSGDDPIIVGNGIIKNKNVIC